MKEETKKLQCGIIMPISPIDGLSADHWLEVKSIITEAIESIEEFEIGIKLVSDADDIGVIQKRIVQNLYNSDIIICDVSGKNPNVMFELGMRLAFDKATVIIKDDKTNYSFDTGIIEHLEYSRDLRFGKIIEFKNKLAKKVLATYKDSQENNDHSPFLKNFGQFKVASLDETKISPDNMMLDMLSDIHNEVSFLRRRVLQQDSRIHDKRINPRIYGIIRETVNFMKEEGRIESGKDLIGDEIFYSIIEDKIKAPLHFEEKAEFNNYVETVLKSLS